MRRVSKRELSINEVAHAYKLTLAAISKHIQVLEKAKLVEKHRKGTFQYIAASPPALKQAAKYLERYKELWEERFEKLDTLLEKTKLLKTKDKKHGKK